jgi:hypothetical protein
VGKFLKDSPNQRREADAYEPAHLGSHRPGRRAGGSDTYGETFLTKFCGKKDANQQLERPERIADVAGACCCTCLPHQRLHVAGPLMRGAGQGARAGYRGRGTH